MRKVLILYRKNDILCFTSIKPLNFKRKFFKSNIKKLLLELKINPSKIIFGKQIHSNKILVVEDNTKGIKKVDGFITNLKNILLCIFTADCVPVFIYEKVIGCIGIVHCGWRGIYKGIIKNAMRKLIKNYRVRPNNLRFILGPSIKKCCYEVSKDLIDRFKRRFKGIGIKERGKRYYLSLDEIIKYEILKFKVPKKNIVECKLCTFCDKTKFFSYRRDGKGTGRMLSGIIME